MVQTPTIAPALPKRRAPGVWHCCRELIVLSFSIPGPAAEWKKKILASFLTDLHVEGSWIKWPPPHTPTPYGQCVATHTHTLQSPPRLRACIVETAAKGTACLGEKVRASEKRVGNQFLEKIPPVHPLPTVRLCWVSFYLFLFLGQCTFGTVASATHPPLSLRLIRQWDENGMVEWRWGGQLLHLFYGRLSKKPQANIPQTTPPPPM